MPNDGSPERRAYEPVGDDVSAAQIFDPVAFAKRLDAARAQRVEALARRRDGAAPEPARPAEPTARPAGPPRDAARPAPPEPMVAPPRRTLPRRDRGPRRFATAGGLLALCAVAALTLSTDLRDSAAMLVAGAPADDRAAPGVSVSLTAAAPAPPREDAAPLAVATAPAERPPQPAAAPEPVLAPAAAPAEARPAPPAPASDRPSPPTLAALDRPSALAPQAPQAAAGFVIATATDAPVRAAAAPPAAGDDAPPPRPPSIDAPAVPTTIPGGPIPDARVAAGPGDGAARSGPDPAGQPPAAAAGPGAEPSAEPPVAVAQARPAPAGGAPRAADGRSAAAAPDAPAIAVHAPPGLSDAALADAIAALGASGFDAVYGVRVGFQVGATHVRYFHASDIPVARRLAAALRAGGGAEIRDFTHFTPPPVLGRLEVWLSGAAPPVRAVAPAAPPPTPQSAAAPARPAATVTTTRLPAAAPARRAPDAAPVTTTRLPAAAPARRAPDAAPARPVPAMAIGRPPSGDPARPRQTPLIERLLEQAGVAVPGRNRRAAEPAAPVRSGPAFDPDELY